MAGVAAVTIVISGGAIIYKNRRPNSREEDMLKLYREILNTLQTSQVDDAAGCATGYVQKVAPGTPVPEFATEYIAEYSYNAQGQMVQKKLTVTMDDGWRSKPSASNGLFL